MILPNFLRFIDRFGGTLTPLFVFSAASPVDPIALIKVNNLVSKANSQQGRPRPAAKPHTSIETEIDPEPFLQPHLFSIVSPEQKSFISNLHVRIILEKINDRESLVQIDFGDFDASCIVHTDNFQFHEVELIMSKIRMYVTHAVKKHHDL
jgi:hypothetical protein